ncbi:4'-phosphopantetheinyl transferase family protein [Paracidobacterium acidisoli]|nr:4'-phosphopantetheinyl transferase superfamily protein [Paracidobacterium acidisoli]MBT9330250.1 4'-phosphopantetheinyl transferase superfamily protein [Paracidobacterium acidisoli]
MSKPDSSFHVLSWPKTLAGEGHEAASRQHAASFRPAPHLAADQVHVWTLKDYPADIAACASLLSREELDRASRFRFPHLFDRFVADHGRLRLLLGAYLETDPRSLVFAVNAFGKPRLEKPHCHLRFNMSHSLAVTMVAVCLDAEIGIDVEAVRPVTEWVSIASSHFSAIENEALAALPEEESIPAFFRCWTRKESFIKAKGTGLSLPLHSFSVSTAPGAPPALLHCDWDTHEGPRWSLSHLEPEPGYVGSLALERKGWSTLYFAWPESEVTL